MQAIIIKDFSWKPVEARGYNLIVANYNSSDTGVRIFRPSRDLVSDFKVSLIPIRVTQEFVLQFSRLSKQAACQLNQMENF